MPDPKPRLYKGRYADWLNSEQARSNGGALCAATLIENINNEDSTTYIYLYVGGSIEEEENAKRLLAWMQTICMGHRTRKRQVKVMNAVICYYRAQFPVEARYKYIMGGSIE